MKFGNLEQLGGWGEGAEMNHLGPIVFIAPIPTIAEPDRGQQMKRSRLGAAVEGGDFDQNIFGLGFRVFDKHIEVTVFVENSSVDQFVFGILPGAASIFFDEV